MCGGFGVEIELASTGVIIDLLLIVNSPKFTQKFGILVEKNVVDKMKAQVDSLLRCFQPEENGNERILWDRVLQTAVDYAKLLVYKSIDCDGLNCLAKYYQSTQVIVDYVTSRVWQCNSEEVEEEGHESNIVQVLKSMFDSLELVQILISLSF